MIRRRGPAYRWIPGGAAALLLVAGLQALPITPAVAAPAPPLSLVSDGAVSGDADTPATSADGRYVAYLTTQPLVPGDGNGVRDVYLKDMSTGATTLVSVTPTGTAGNGESGPAIVDISDDGTKVVFRSAASDLVAADANNAPGIFVRDLTTGTTTRVNVNNNGTTTGSGCDCWSASADGNKVAFLSEIGLDGNQPGIYIRDVAARTTVRVPTVGIVAAAQVAISGDGSKVAYLTLSTPSSGSTTNELYVWNGLPDGAGAVNTQINYNTSSNYADPAGLLGPNAMSFNGDVVAFWSDGDAYDLVNGVPRDVNGVRDVFVYDEAIRNDPANPNNFYAMRRVSEVPDGPDPDVYPDDGNAASGGTTNDWPKGAVSADGTKVAFTSQASNLAPGAPSGGALVKDRTTGAIVTASNDGSSSVGVSETTISSDGTQAAFATSASLNGDTDGGSSDVFEASLVAPSGPPTPTGLTLTVDEGDSTTGPGATSVPLSRIPAAAVPLDPSGGAGVGGTPLRSVDVAASPLRSVPLRSVPLRSVPLRSVPLRSVTLSELRLNRGSWEQILASLVPNPFVGVPLQAITLDQLLDANPPALASVSLGDIDLGSTPLRSVTLGSVALGALPLRSVPFPGAGTSFENFCAALVPLGYTCEALGVTPDSSLLAADLAGVPLRSVPLRSVPLRSVPLRSVDLTAIGVSPESVPLRSVPLRSVNWSSAVGTIPLSIIDPAALPSIVDCAAPGLSCATGTLQDAATANAFVADVSLGALFDAINPALLPEGLTLADLLQALVNPADYPWESVSLGQIGLADFQQDGPQLTYGLSFSVGGTGQATGTATVTLPDGFRYVPGSTTRSEASFEPLVQGNRLVWSNVSTPGGAQNISWTFRVRPGLRLTGVEESLGSSAKVDIGGNVQEVQDAAGVEVREPGFTDCGGDVCSFTDGNDSPAGAPVLAKDTLTLDYVARQGDVDYFRYPVPPAGTRVQLFLSHQKADNDLLLYGNAASTPLRSVPLRSVPLRSVPLTDEGVDTNALNEQASAETLNDIPIVESVPLRSVSESRSAADEVITTTSRGEGGFYTIQVAGFNGATSQEPYMLRVKEYTPPPPPICAGARTLASAGQGARGGALDLASLPRDLNTLIVTSEKRLGDTYGSGEATKAVDALGKVATSASGAGVVGAILRVDATASSPADTTLAAWDADPCSVAKANAAFDEVYKLVHAVRAARPSLKNIVVAGGDDIIPMARIADYTQISNESDYATSTVTDDLTNNGTRTSAAQATENILTDDPLADIDAIRWLDHTLHIPDLGIGRLVESPADIVAQANQFEAAKGVLDPKTALTTGYDFLSDGSEAVDTALAARIPDASRQKLVNETWSRSDVTSRLFPATGASPDVASLNAHYDHSRALPALGNSTADESDLFSVAQDVKAPANVLKLQRRVLFTMGCHAGLSVPDAYLNAGSTKAPDWTQTYLGDQQKAAVYFANTGFGYGDTAAVAYSEEVMRQFAKRLDGSLSVGMAATFAKQAYFGALGTYTAYDEKAAQEATFYGFPMYKIGTVATPTPQLDTVTPDSIPGSPLSAVPVSVDPTFTPKTSRNGGSYYTVNGGAFTVDGAPRTVTTGEAQLAQNRPVEPRVSVPATAAGGALAHGVLITELTSADTAIVPAISRPTIDLTANEPPPPAGDVNFPTSFQNLTTFNTPAGQEQRVVFLPGQFFREGQAPSAAGVQRLFSHIGAEVVYSASTDNQAPQLRDIQSYLDPGTATASFALRAVDPEGSVGRVIVLVKDGSGLWRRVELTASPGSDFYEGSLNDIVGPRIEYFAQAQDGAGNVGISTNKGRYFGAALAGQDAVAPKLVTSPVVPNGANGWYTGPVEVRVATTPPDGATYTLKVDGVTVANPSTGTTVSLDGTHLAEVTGSDGSRAVLGIAIDATLPTVPVISGAMAGATYQNGPGTTCSSSDATSGLESCRVTTAPAPSGSPSGSVIATATATDRAGNTRTSTLTYRVEHFSGFLQPIKDTGHTITPNTSIFKAGSSVPVKFQLGDAAGNSVQATSAPTWLTPVRTDVRIGQTGPDTALASKGSGVPFTWDPVTKTYSFTWKSPSKPTGYNWRIGVRLADGRVYDTYVGLR